MESAAGTTAYARFDFLCDVRRKFCRLGLSKKLLEKPKNRI